MSDKYEFNLDIFTVVDQIRYMGIIRNTTSSIPRKQSAAMCDMVRFIDEFSVTPVAAILAQDMLKLLEDFNLAVVEVMKL